MLASGETMFNTPRDAPTTLLDYTKNCELTCKMSNLYPRHIEHTDVHTLLILFIHCHQTLDDEIAKIYTRTLAQRIRQKNVSSRVF